MGILTKSTKSRLEELEVSKEDLEIKIANEKIAKPRISAEFVTFWLHKFRKLDINRQDHRKWLINVFVNAIYLYDDNMIITFNYKDGTKTITLDDVKRAIKKENTGSDLNCHGAPTRRGCKLTVQEKRRIPGMGSSVRFFSVIDLWKTILSRNVCNNHTPKK